MAHFIHNNKWHIPQEITAAFPNLQHKLNLITIPLSHKEDKLIWSKTHDGDLSFKDSYLFHCSPPAQSVNWGKFIWNASIPPSKSLLMWRILHDKMPTDDHLIERGCQITSICNLCGVAAETSAHLFLECTFAIEIWCWLQSIINVNVSLHNFAEPFKIYAKNWSPQCKLVILAAIINCFNTIWYCRNQRRFNDKIINICTAKNMIISNTNLSGNTSTLTARSSITEFVIMKHFDVKIKPPKPTIIKEVIWSPPMIGWTKCNTDGAALSSNGMASCGGLFRNSNSDFLGAFAVNLGRTTALCSELIGAMVAIEIAHHKTWNRLWLETDSMLVFSAFKSHKIVPWHLQNRWNNCLHLISSMHFYVTHVYREGNHCADILANIGLNLHSHCWYTQLPPSIRADLVTNSLGLPNFRIS